MLIYCLLLSMGATVITVTINYFSFIGLSRK